MRTCGNCKSYVFEPGVPGESCPEHYCDMNEWDGLASEDELEVETDCELWREKE